MARIFITGSSTGLGLMAAELLVAQGHQVVLHARNALEPGWVPTRMGGAGAPDDLGQAHRTQAWLAACDDPRAQGSGQYFYHMRPLDPNPWAQDAALQDRLIALCASCSGVVLPA
jgi:nucleoside-diphosphate-sugar epimerase